MSEILDRPMTSSQMAALASIGDRTEQIGWTSKVPASEYLDPARYALEMELWRRTPLLGALSADLPKPGMYLQNELLGAPVLLTRAKDGMVRAFINVCRHRGTQLCPDAEAVEGSRIVCPYHAWTYGLDGALLAIPRQEAFPGVSKSDYDLVQLSCVEAGGLIWISVRPGEPLDFSEVTGELEDELDALNLAGMHVYRKAVYPLAANWKLVMDTMLEKYHVLRLHKDTLAKYNDDDPEVSDTIGPHVRSASGRIRNGAFAFDKSHISDRYEQIRRVTNFGYTLFPNGMIVTSPLYISLIIIRPVDIAHSRVDYYMLITDTVARGDFSDKLKRSWDLMDISFGQEDFRAAELGQIGLSSGTLDHLIVGGLEYRMRLFHDTLNARLEKLKAELSA